MTEYSPERVQEMDAAFYRGLKKVPGWLLFWAGFALIIWAFFMDVGVPSGIGDVANLQLLGEQLARVVAGGAFMVAGAVFISIRR
jgi:hypothetical protein